MSVAPLRSALRSACFAGCAVMAACSPIVASRGNLPAPDAIASIQPGRHTRTEVTALLGSPSSVGAFDDRAWYYISQRAEAVAFFAPEITEQKVVMVRFNELGVVERVETRGLEQAKAIDPVERATPTTGHSMTFVEQLFGNIGQYNEPAKGSGSAAPAPGPGRR